MCLESYNTNRLLVGTFILLHIPNILSLQHGGLLLVAVDREFSDVTARYL